jgi:hypothetical protein
MEYFTNIGNMVKIFENIIKMIKQPRINFLSVIKD